jgi:hypothetical protein
LEHLVVVYHVVFVAGVEVHLHVLALLCAPCTVRAGRYHGTPMRPLSRKACGLFGIQCVIANVARVARTWDSALGCHVLGQLAGTSERRFKRTLLRSMDPGWSASMNWQATAPLAVCASTHRSVEMPPEWDAELAPS